MAVPPGMYLRTSRLRPNASSQSWGNQHAPKCRWTEVMQYATPMFPLLSHQSTLKKLERNFLTIALSSVISYYCNNRVYIKLRILETGMVVFVHKQIIKDSFRSWISHRILCEAYRQSNSCHVFNSFHEMLSLVLVIQVVQSCSSNNVRGSLQFGTLRTRAESSLGKRTLWKPDHHTALAEAGAYRI